MRKALITGVTGQDGAYLAQFLLQRGYTVFGAYRRTSSTNFWRLQELGIDQDSGLQLVEFDLTDQGGIFRLVAQCEPDEIYNLAAQSFVGVSFAQPATTTAITGIGAVYLLEAIRAINRRIRFYQASTSEMFGKVQETPQTESTPFYPRSPYGIAKLYAHWMTINYRESYDMFAASGILFNHESPLRGREFVTRKITDGIARIVTGRLDCLELGNLDARRDWGFAKEYVEGMYKMLQIDRPDEFVLATNRSVSVRDFVTMTCKAAGFELAWRGAREAEHAVDPASGRTIVRVSPALYRPAEVDALIGDPTKAKTILGWEATTDLEALCYLMYSADLQRIRSGLSF
ncbi:MAG: GDP-mannose 4,6-dehydratase [Steroidobacteraceae bacterium]